MEESNYYPFGLKHQGYNEGSLLNDFGTNYKYSFQGQERQEETGWSSFKWRNYDPSIGRFFNVDPLSEKYAYQSHYNFSENAVVNARELEGLEKVVVLGRSTAAAGAAAQGSTKAGAYNELKRYTQTSLRYWLEVADYNYNLIKAGGTFGIAVAAKVLKSEDSKGSKAQSSDTKGSDAKSADDKQKISAEEGKRRKNRIPDKGEPNTVETNEPETTAKKYGPDGNVQKEYNKGHGPNYPKNEQDDHVHDYKPNPYNPSGRGDRQPGRPPKKGELLRDFNIKKN